MGNVTPTSARNSLIVSTRPAVVHADAHDLEVLSGEGFVQLLQLGHLVAAGRAPGGPDVEQVGGPRQLRAVELAPVQRGRGERGNLVAGLQGLEIGHRAGRPRQGRRQRYHASLHGTPPSGLSNRTAPSYPKGRGRANGAAGTGEPMAGRGRADGAEGRRAGPGAGNARDPMARWPVVAPRTDHAGNPRTGTGRRIHRRGT